jgi:hypothetical protein
LDKLHRLTRNYGAASRDNIPAEPNRLKLMGPEGAIGYGADVSVPRIRADRIARRPMQANPPQFKKGGSVKKRASGGAVVTPGMAKRARGGTLGQAMGAAGVSDGPAPRKGRGKGFGGGGGGKPHTKVNVIVAPQPGGGGGPQNASLPPVHPALMGGPGGMPPGLPPPPMAGAGGPPPGGPGGPGGLPPAALAALMGGGGGGMPPSAIPRPGPGAMGPPGMPPPGLPVRKKGGAVHDDEAQDERLIKRVLKQEGLKRARGGGLHINKHYGGGSGMGRLEKIGEKLPRP